MTAAGRVENGREQADLNSEDRVRDCVVVGGGIAGLTAAWNLRDRDALVLEAENRVGGRIRSEQRGDYWLSVGAHMFPEPDSIVGRMVEELQLETLRINGDLLGLWMGGKLVRGGRAETYPVRLPLEPRARIDLVASGLRIRRAAAEYERLSRASDGASLSEIRHRLLAFMDDRPFSELVGRVHPQVDALFRTTAHRMTAEPEEVAAGCMAALFAHVWSSGDAVLGRNMRGGSAELPLALARELGNRVRTSTAVTSVTVESNRTVSVEYDQNGERGTIRARRAIIATPAYVTKEILAGQPADLAAALESIDYGPFVVAAILTNETERMPWDDLYSVVTPGLDFTMFFNHANVLRTRSGPRQPGGTIMLYAGAGPGRTQLERSDEQIRDAFLTDLARVFPQTRGIIEDVWIQRWPHAQPFQKPGRSRHQPAFERGLDGCVFLAGDYTGDWAQMESAAQMGREAAIAVRSSLRESALQSA